MQSLWAVPPPVADSEHRCMHFFSHDCCATVGTDIVARQSKADAQTSFDIIASLEVAICGPEYRCGSPETAGQWQRAKAQYITTCPLHVCAEAAADISFGTRVDKHCTWRGACRASALSPKCCEGGRTPCRLAWPWGSSCIARNKNPHAASTQRGGRFPHRLRSDTLAIREPSTSLGDARAPVAALPGRRQHHQRERLPHATGNRRCRDDAGGRLNIFPDTLPIGFIRRGSLSLFSASSFLQAVSHIRPRPARPARRGMQNFESVRAHSVTKRPLEPSDTGCTLFGSNWRRLRGGRRVWFLLLFGSTTVLGPGLELGPFVFSVPLRYSAAVEKLRTFRDVLV